jgi:hypothetical protein
MRTATDLIQHNFKVNQQNVDDKGQSFSLTFQAKFDGKEYAVSGDSDYDSASILHISERELKVTWKKAGKRVGENDKSVQ